MLLKQTQTQPQAKPKKQKKTNKPFVNDKFENQYSP
jgi:hypothetical protein